MGLLSVSSPMSASVLSVKVKPTTRTSRSLSLKTSLDPPRATALGYGFEDSLRVTASDAQRKNAMMNAAADPMGLLLKERIVFLGYEINDFIADAIVSQLLLLDAQDHTKDIRLFINSPGGSMSSTMAIFDAIQLVRADVSTVAIGIAASTASLILGGGTKGKRLAMPNTRIMIHQPLGGTAGDIAQVEVQFEEIIKIKDNIMKIVSGFSGRSLFEVDRLIQNDCYLSPVEAMEYGIIDGVIDRDIIIPLKPEPEQIKGTLNYAEKMLLDSANS